MRDRHYVITIERQYGSGGRLTGERLAKELGIHFYDEEILKMTSETSAIGEQYFRLADEKAGNKLLYRIVTSLKPDLSEPAKTGHRITPRRICSASSPRSSGSWRPRRAASSWDGAATMCSRTSWRM